ncbi:MAG: hypothetical protein AAF192_10650 [Pseudomonadota bacterium]
MKVSTAFAGLVLAFALASPASAVTTGSFDFTGPNQSLGATEVFTDGSSGLSVLVSAFNPAAPGATGSVGDISQNGNGIGVETSPENNRLAGGERLRFDFAPQKIVSTAAVVFENQEQDETFQLIVDGSVLDDFTILGSSTAPVSFDFTSLLAPLDTTYFEIRGTSPAASGNRGILIDSLTATVIPVPPAILGVISAFGLAFGVRRFARRADA